MITRLSYDESVKQFRLACLGTVLSLLIPVIVRKLHVLTRMTRAYVFVGIGLLGLVMVASRSVNGSKLTLTVAGFTFQPSEFVKIIFVFAVAGLLAGEHSLKRIILATVLAANVMTNPLAVALHLCGVPQLPIELGVVLAEGFAYSLHFDKRPWLLALVSNAFSWGLGLLLL